MATRIIKVCDRCYKEYNPYEKEQMLLGKIKLPPIQNVKFDISYGFDDCDPAYIHNTGQQDLCPQCAKQLLTWFYNKEKNNVVEE